MEVQAKKSGFSAPSNSRRIERELEGTGCAQRASVDKQPEQFI
jgi:hypothetical protein